MQSWNPIRFSLERASLPHLLLFIFMRCLFCQFVLFLALVKYKLLMVSLSSNSICTFIKKMCFLQNPLTGCWCHEIKLMVEWMLHDLSTLTSPDEWSERNNKYDGMKRERKKGRKSYLSSVWKMSDKLMLNELMKRYMQRRKIKCLNDSSQNKTVKWLNIYLCWLFSFAFDSSHF